MLIQLLKSKIQELKVSSSSLDYPGSIGLPEELLVAAKIKPFEKVYVNNKTNGNRIITYAVKSSSAGRVTLNGAAAHKFNDGDLIHVITYAYSTEEEAEHFEPQLVLCNDENGIVEVKPYRL